MKNESSTEKEKNLKMSFLLKALNEELEETTSEIGIKVAPNITKLDLNKMITSSKYYEEELTKEMLEGIKIDIERREWRDQQDGKNSKYLTGIKSMLSCKK
ncbi:hypothetical protein NPIL_474591 [Nephila pilipes]|uniref:Uncharacterized protein n=1 Tax=Nephila pilipes TaxID=299642 RepID=A0A8X6N2C8_NEPPI|nr:hypothetical protein NPIL_474591 [Nephila pilipes]